MRSLSPADRDYPERLRDLPRPPDPLWVDGDLPDENAPTVGIVGTRRSTPYGARVAREVATAVAAAGAVVVSGLAQGIDSIAHEAALEAGSATLAVLGEGILAFDTAGPIARRRLAARIRDHGAVVSEFALDTGATRSTFPRRNATIAALSQVVVVVEAPERSGALITAERARVLLHRPVFAVAGPFGEPTWAGSHEMLHRGEARLLTDPSDLLRAIGRTAAGLPASSDPLLDLLAAGPASADAIAAHLARPRAEVPVIIARHLVAGTIEATPDGRFARR